MRCSNCQQENPDGASFCAKCSAPLPVLCLRCGGLNDSDAAFCNRCGSVLDKASSQADPPTEAFAPSNQGVAVPDAFGGGRFKVNRLLGEGATKAVYLVHDTVLDRDVAFALIKAVGIGEDERERILNEARTMARLGGHPNIMEIYEFGEEDGLPFMVLPLMTGGTAEELVAKPESTEGGRRVSVLRRQEGAPVLLG